MANLHRSWGAFWTFHFFSYVAFLSVQGLFRTLGFFFSSYDAAFRMGGFLVTGLVFFTGYLIPVQQMKRWLFWMVSRTFPYLLQTLSAPVNSVLFESHGLR